LRSLPPDFAKRVHAQGIVDMCIGPYWTMSDRAAVAPFTLPFYDEEWYMFVPRPEEQPTPIMDQIYKPFQPFR
jgi:hypothetical protein